MTYAAKVAADGATHYWPMNDSGTPVTPGTPSASAEPFGSSFNAAKVVDASYTTGWAISAALCNGSWWRQDWGGSQTARGVRLRARDSSNATAGTDNNPVATVDLSDGTSLSIPAIAVNGQYYLDFGSSKTFTWLKVTFNAGAPGGGNPGWSDCRVGGDCADTIGTTSVVEQAASAFTYGAAGPSSISGSGGVTVPAADGSVLFGLAPGITGNADRTLECWYKTTRTGFAMLAAFGSNATNQLFALMLNSDGGFSADLICSSQGGSNRISATEAAVHDGSYHHLVVVYDAATHSGEFFFDGTSVGSGAFPANIATGSDFINLGDLSYQNSSYLGGTLSNVALYASKLTSTQIADHALGDASSGGGGGAFSQAIVIA